MDGIPMSYAEVRDYSSSDLYPKTILVVVS